MPDLGSMDRPVYSGEMFQEPKPSPLEQVKPYFGKIITAIILIIIAYFVYWFFIGSYQEVRIVITGLDSPMPEGVFGSITQDGKTISSITSSSQTLRLKDGTYDVEASASGFKPARQQIEVKAGQSRILIELEQDLSVKITGVSLLVNDAEGKVFAGKNTPAMITLSNTGQAAEVEIEAKGDSGITASTQPSRIIIPANSQGITATLTINIPAAIKVDDRVNGDSKTLTLRVKGLKETASKTLQVLPRLSINLSPNPLNFGTVKANNVAVLKTLTFQNRESFEVKGKVKFSVVVESGSANSPSEVVNWFNFYPEIESIEKTPATTVTVQLTVPPTADVPETSQKDRLVGTITASSDAWSETANFEFYVTKAKTLIKNPTLSVTNASITKGDFRQTVLTIENDSDFPISDVQIAIEQACKDTFIKDVEKTIITEIPTDSQHRKVTVNMNLTAPLDAEADRPKTCNINISYADPLSPGERIQLPDSITVIITPKAA